ARSITNRLWSRYYQPAELRINYCTNRSPCYYRRWYRFTKRRSLCNGIRGWWSAIKYCRFRSKGPGTNGESNEVGSASWKRRILRWAYSYEKNCYSQQPNRRVEDMRANRYSS